MSKKSAHLVCIHMLVEVEVHINVIATKAEAVELAKSSVIDTIEDGLVTTGDIDHVSVVEHTEFESEIIEN